MVALLKCEDARGTEGWVMKTYVMVAVVFGLIIAMAMAAAAASVSAKSPTSSFRVSVIGGHQGLVPIW
jgi:hypothetical protein